MKNGKKVFVVIGIEDGNIGVFTNKKKAYEAAYNYACSAENAGSEENVKLAMTYSQICKRLQIHDHASITDYSSTFGSAEIEQHYLNY